MPVFNVVAATFKWPLGWLPGFVVAACLKQGLQTGAFGFTRHFPMAWAFATKEEL
jgi:hypothetical protein